MVEYISEELKQWAQQKRIALRYIQPGNPQQNAYIERFNRTVRYDWLGHYLFESLNELQEFATNWLWVYNHELTQYGAGRLHAETALGTGRMTSTFECSKKWGDYH